ncbi:hypothetical protein BYT27DRAFT_6380328 [Phlegmacium glaucopus]|nr:hypothetical protein BYT27DRAFT_6380328 [Phlegmacium glaucopus]
MKRTSSDDYLLPPYPTEKDFIEQKRHQDTIAAGRSRKRKLGSLSKRVERRNSDDKPRAATSVATINHGLSVFKVIKCFNARALRHVPMQCFNRISLASQHLFNTCRLLGCRVSFYPCRQTSI